MARVLTTLSFVILIVLSVSSAQEVVGKKTSHEDQGAEFPVKSRKLKLIITDVNKQEVAPGKLHTRKGTRQEWMEGTHSNTDDVAEFYTMDYHAVKRRRPVHNKAIPFRHP